VDNLQVLNDALGVVAEDGIAKVSSRKVAENFGKRHDHVIRDIEDIIQKLPPNFGEISLDAFNFEEIFYKDSYGRKQPEYLMNRDGFTLLVMGFTGKKALEFKIRYIRRFNEMEQYIQARLQARMEYPELTANIKLAHEEPKFYHFSNEADLINRIALGMTAKEYRMAHDLKDGDSIRDHLTPQEIETIHKLQALDAGLVFLIPDFQERKAALQKYFDSIMTEKDKTIRLGGVV